MDNGAFKLLESATQRTLHAHNFARASSHASVVLTDLLGRYLHLLASTCAKHAALSGRVNLAPADAFDALKDAGVDLADLASFCATEAREMTRYAAHTARRTEDLVEFRNTLSLGLRADRDDAFPLFFGQVPPEVLEEEQKNDVGDEDDEELNDAGMSDVEYTPLPAVEVQPETEVTASNGPVAAPSHRLKALMPPSPISIPSSPSRKRPREEQYLPSPPNIPSHLPPLPRMSTYTDGNEHSSPSPIMALPTVVHPPSNRPEHIVGSSGPTASALQASTQASAADYTTPVPYDGSTLRDVPEWNLPQSFPFSALPTSQMQSALLPTPQTQPSLFAAYHHVLTHPPPKGAVPAANPQRHRVALGLLGQHERLLRWEPPDTLFGASAPPMPQVSRNPPIFPIALNDSDSPRSPRSERAPPPPTPTDSQGKDKAPLPPVQSRTLVGTGQHIVPMISQPGSRIPDLSRQILPPALHMRVTRLAHPPVLQRGSKRLVYGPSVLAPWNSGGSQTPPTGPAKDAKGRSMNSKDGDAPHEEPGISTLPDARLHHTWDYEEKRYNEPLVANRGLKQKGAQVLIPDPPPATNGNGNALRRLSTIAIPPAAATDSPTVRKNVISLPRRDSVITSIPSSRRDSVQSYMD